MKTKRKSLAKVCALFMAVIMICLIAFSLSTRAKESKSGGAVKNIITHDIAIVFDNSGSMYDNESWCQALYAMEVFASMLDYEHDKLGIYPMGDIQIGKSGKSITERLDISSKDDVKNIEKIYSKTTTETILKPAYNATEYLKKSKLNEKWLIVLTDGEFYFDKDSKKEEKSVKSSDWLNSKLLDFAGDSGVNVQYLGFAEASKLNGNESKNFYATNATTADELTAELVKICNKIFQRNEISNIASDGSFSIDVSMNSIIAFVQGKGAKINSLKGSDGKDVAPAMNTRLEAGTEGTGNKKYPAPIADVAGQVVTYDNCGADTYTLDFTGSNVQIFYEPNVVVKTALLDSDGIEVNLAEKVLPGDYILSYGLADTTTGKDVTGSQLLNPVKLSATVKNNDTTTEGAPSGTPISLQLDSQTEIDVSGTYLKDYYISNADESGTFTIDVQPSDIPSDALSVKVTVTNLDFGHKWYKFSDHENWKPIRVKVSYQGQPLTDEQLSGFTTLSFKPDIPYRAELLSGESAYNVYIGQDEDGKYIEPEGGSYEITADVTFTEEYGREVSGSGRDSFEVHGYSSIWRWLIYIVILAALILLTIFVLNLPAWPRKISFVVERPKDDEGLRATVKVRPTGMPIVPYEDAVFCNAKKNSKVKDWLFKPKGMSIIASGFTSEEIIKFSTGGHTYTSKDGEFVCRGVESEIIFNGSQFEYTFLNGTKGSGHIEIH